MTFLQLMLAVEEMQSQQRAENGIKEVVIGYVGVGPVEQELEDIPMDLIEGMDQAYEVSIADLPPDVRDVLLAENHRLRTGEVITIEEFKRKEGK